MLTFAGRIVYNEKKEEVFNFGKYRGTSVKEVLKRGSRLLWLDDEWRFSSLYKKGPY